MISEDDARALHEGIGAALRGDLTGLPRALEIAELFLFDTLPEWQWENDYLRVLSP